jgi:nicotinamide phosphoribosyltransferase
MENNITLPKRKIYETPRLLLADAYTIGSDLFQSEEAKEKSVYYVVFRKELFSINPHLYNKDDNRIVFVGLGRILEKLFYKPITHQEIDETKEFLKTYKVTLEGLKEYYFPEYLWRRVVDEFNGRPPIKIMAMPEGSIVYPNEPVIQISSEVKGFGELAAWFESKILQVFASSERVTQDRHWFEFLKSKIRYIDPYMSDDEVSFISSTLLADFGDRSGFNLEESQELGMYHLYTYTGTDTASGAYQAWKNSNNTTMGSSVYALAHRNVQAYSSEKECYEALYEKADNNSFISMVGDLNHYKTAVEKYILPLAMRSSIEGNGKIVVARPDSGDAIEEILFTIKLAIENGLYTTKVIDSKEWKFATTLKFIEADGMSFEMMKKIINTLIDNNIAFYSWGLFGVGGGLRDNIKRDHLSAKYALCAKGVENIGVVKFSDTFGKTTLPGPFKILRTQEALNNCKTIIFESEEGVNSMVEYFNGVNIYKPFGIGQDDDMVMVKARIDNEFSSMPLTLKTDNNHNFPASDLIIQKRKELLIKFAPDKDINNY